jgi:Ring finger domain
MCCCRRCSTHHPLTPSSASESGDSVRLLELGKIDDPEVAYVRSKERRFSKGEFLVPGSDAQIAQAKRTRAQMEALRAAAVEGRRAAAADSSAGSSSNKEDALLDAEDEPECVICLGSFNWQDPAVLTLCACGMNKTLFHYACLLQWLEQHSYCPACRAELYFEETSGAAAAAAAAASSSSSAITSSVMR